MPGRFATHSKKEAEGLAELDGYDYRALFDALAAAVAKAPVKNPIAYMGGVAKRLAPASASTTKAYDGHWAINH